MGRFWVDLLAFLIHIFCTNDFLLKTCSKSYTSVFIIKHLTSCRFVECKNTSTLNQKLVSTTSKFHQTSSNYCQSYLLLLPLQHSGSDLSLAQLLHSFSVQQQHGRLLLRPLGLRFLQGLPHLQFTVTQNRD